MRKRQNEHYTGWIPAWLRGWLPGARQRHQSGLDDRRGQRIHVIIIDGTMSSLAPGCETNVGQIFRLLGEMGSAVSLFYEAGIQWSDWGATRDVLLGRGINRQIRRAYGYLASRYRPGDRIVLLGYSRGAYAARSLAGVIDRVGLVRAEKATTRNIRLAYRHYERGGRSEAAARFADIMCHPETPIEMVGVFDTVKSLGLRLPLIAARSQKHYAFHDHKLGPAIRRGYHALAMDETRDGFAPVLWHSRPEWHGTLDQVWFTGTHGDVGGQLGGFEAARPLANIPLVWMLGRLEECDVPLPENWRDRFSTDPEAPSVGTWRGWGKLFLVRHRREVGRDPSERIHESAQSENADRTDGLPA